MKIFILTLLFSLSALSGITENQDQIKVIKDQINITVKEGFHLNKEAPASAKYDSLAVNQLPTKKTEKLFVFKKDKSAKMASIKYYVCDDKKTVCEPHEKTINFKTGIIKKTENKSNYQSNKDFSLVSQNGKPTLLVFSAPWCPACIRMQTESYNKPEVKKQLEKLNFIKLNSDVADNYELSEKYKIKAIPTMIMLDKNGLETFRWLDFQSAKEFSKSLNSELKKVDQAEVIFKNAELGDPAAASTLAFKAFNSLDYEGAIKWFLLAKSAKDQKYKLAAEVSLAQEAAEANAKLTDDYVQTIQKAISLTTSRLDQLRWTIDYLEKKKELKELNEESILKAQARFTELDRLIKNTRESEKIFLDSTYGNYAGFEKEELLWLKSRLYGILDRKADKEKNDKESILTINKKNLTPARPGEMLLAISYLKEAGEIKKVDELYQKLIKNYPHSYVYFEKYARFLQKNKNAELALGFTNEALKYSEGNEPQLSLLKSQLLKDLNKKTEAVAVIEEVLKTEYIQHKRFAKTVKRLNDLKEELIKSSN